MSSMILGSKHFAGGIVGPFEHGIGRIVLQSDLKEERGEGKATFKAKGVHIERGPASLFGGSESSLGAMSPVWSRGKGHV